jgi:DNA (cytosine-5)-methyltransferase 1
VKGPSFTAIDICSGPGGVTTGYKAAGIRVLAAVDIDPAARATYAANHPEVMLLAEDLSKLDPLDLLQGTALEPGQLDILTACVPCQTFSSLARGIRARDPRNKLVLQVARFVEALQPRAVVMENVPQLRQDLRFKLLLGRLRRCGYGIWSDIVDCSDFGVPQRRRRLVLIAIKGVRDDDVPRLSTGNPKLRRFLRRRTVRQVLRLVRLKARKDPLARPRTNYPQLVSRRIASIPPNGGSRTSLDAVLELPCHTRIKKSGAGSSYGRMKYDDVAPTLTTRCITPACGRFLHPRANRAITLREAACLQTFPLSYLFIGGTMAVQSQIGNAVPPRLARAIALIVSDALVKRSASERGSELPLEGLQPRRERLGRPGPQATLPERHDLPTESLELAPGPPVASAISLDLRRPEVFVGSWRPTTLAVVAMPEAAMDAEHDSEFGEHDIGATRKVLDVEVESPTEGL